MTPQAPCANGAQAAEVVTPTPAASGLASGQAPVAYVELGFGVGQQLPGRDELPVWRRVHGGFRAVQRRGLLRAGLDTTGKGKGMSARRSGRAGRDMKNRLLIVVVALAGVFGTALAQPAVASAASYPIYFCAGGMAGSARCRAVGPRMRARRLRRR